ncbi:hypothetical protein BZZ01_21015 [Nostocales cyanobacterium HT-58-2]|nr:hypothetical protein BZZ01_21015 [Nostocales cyanobacterium HT-58-2]
MFRKFFLLIVISLWGAVVLPLPQRASAATPLTLAVIQNLRNLVQLMPQDKPKRQARKSDGMSPGDGLSTGRAASVDLRFNDGSLARVGEQALFRFLPKNRNFRLSNGTVLLLIPPGKGHTRINTPNAAAAIRGSGLFVRYDKETDTTLVGALTNSGIKVSNKDASQNQELQAGQLIVIVKDKIKGLYDFDLRTFYETSDLVRGLDLPLKNGVPNTDPAIASVQSETSAAVAAQSPVSGQGVVENPSFLSQPTTSQNSPSENIIRDNSPVETLLDTGQVVTNTGQQSNDRGNKPPTQTPSDGNSGSTPPPVTTPPVTTPPVTTPPVTTPTLTPASSPTPPVTTPTVTTPTVTTPTVTTPPVTTPTVTTPTVTPASPSSPPVTTPTVTTPTVTTPPVTTPTVTTPTVTTPPVTPASPSSPPVTTPPVTTPTVTPASPSSPPVTTPPVTTPTVTPASPSSPPATTPAPPTSSQPSRETPIRPST